MSALDTQHIESIDQLNSLNLGSTAVHSIAFRPLSVAQYYHYKLRAIIIFSGKNTQFYRLFLLFFS